MSNKNNKAELLKLLKELISSSKSLLIFNHFNPDPDSITASFILVQIAKHFKVKTKVVYSGKISYSKNLAILSYLNFKFYVFEPGEEKRFDLIASVDTQKGMSNNPIPQNIYPHLTFDHHPNISKQLFKTASGLEKILLDIRTQYGSAATILLEYYLALGLKFTSKIATAFCYTIITETNHFTRKYNSVDIDYYRKSVQHADLRLIFEIENIKRSVTYFQILSQAIDTYKHKTNVLTCALGKVDSLDFLHEVANFILTMEGVEVVVITGISDGIKKICCRSVRSVNSQLHLGNTLKQALQGIGNGGGHENMAAGEFTVSETKVISSLQEVFKKLGVVKDKTK